MQNKTINGFTLQRLLGTGGMAEVWYAENKIGKKAAVKMLLPKLCQDENVVSRFLTEAKVMVDLNHPNIRQVYDYGDIDGRPAIVMEYLDGDDLKARMKRGQRFTDEELKRWWNQLVDALNYTHKKGIVHRDIKPGNIFVNKEGNIKLLDFGIAKVRESISSTQTGQKLGTLMYMSPEQVKDSKHVDYRTDIYSLAVTFVHLLTGKKPYNSDTSSDFEISEQIVYKPLDLSGLPEMWQNFLAPYLNKDPERRPALRHFENTSAPANLAGSDDDGTTVGDAPVKTTPKKVAPKPEPKPEPSEKPKSKKGLWIGLGAVAIAAVAAVLVAFNMKPSEPALFPAPKGNKWGYIDKKGNFVIEPKYDRTCEFSEGYAAVEVDGLYGYINTDGEMAVAPKFTCANPFTDGMAKVHVNGDGYNYYSGLCGYIDTKGNLVVDTQFDPGGAWYYSEGVAPVLGEGGWGFIDKEGKYVIEPQFCVASGFSEGLASVDVRLGQCGYVDHSGNMVIAPRFSYAGPFSDGIACIETDSLWGAIDKQGNVIIQPQYYDYFSFSEGLAAVRMDGGIGFIDKSNKVVIQPRFDWAENFSEGLAAVAIDGECGVINKSGNWVVMPQYETVHSFKNGLAEVWFDGNTMGYIDKTGKVIYMDDSQPNPDDRAYQACETVEDYRAYIRDYGRDAIHYNEATQFVDNYMTDSIQQARQAIAEAEKGEEAAFNNCTTIAYCESYLADYPQGQYVDAVKKKKKKLEGIRRKAPLNEHNYVDLGLPSGVLWSDKNENGWYSQAEAINYFGQELPTISELSELVNNCTWKVVGDSYKVIGPNNNFILLPANGCDESESGHFAYRVGNYGTYWSSSVNGRTGLGFYLADKYYFLWEYEPIRSLSVRLVKRE